MLIRGREAATSPTRRGDLLPGLPSSPLADRAAQDGPKFAPRTEHPPHAMLKAATPLQEIADYCMRDVELVRKIYYRMSFAAAEQAGDGTPGRGA
jgi:hypothetical protein